MPFSSKRYRMDRYPPQKKNSAQGETAPNRGGVREPSFFCDPYAKCCPWRYIWGVATKKPAEEAGRVMGLLNIASMVTTCSVDV